MEEQNASSKQISDALRVMNDSSIEVRKASKDMQGKNKEVINQMDNFRNATDAMSSGMEEMNICAKKINETGVALDGISHKVKDSINKIGSQIDLFTV